MPEVVDAYEVLSHAVDPNEGPGWPDVTAAAAERRLQQYKQLRERLAALEGAQLSDRSGPMPLDILERRMRSFSEQGGPPSSAGR